VVKLKFNVGQKYKQQIKRSIVTTVLSLWSVFTLCCVFTSYTRCLKKWHCFGLP